MAAGLCARRRQTLQAQRPAATGVGGRNVIEFGDGAKWWHRPLAGASAVAVLLALTACGGGSSGNTPPTAIGTLAYVLTECRDTPEGFFEHQQLRIRQGDHEPITVMQPPGVGPVGGVSGLCRALTTPRFGGGSLVREAIQAVLVSPDAATVAFEVSDAFSISPPLPLHIPPEQQGIFVVGSDGTNLRRLGPPSPRAVRRSHSERRDFHTPRRRV